MRKPINLRPSNETIPSGMTGAAGASLGGDSGSKNMIKKTYTRPGSTPGQSAPAEQKEKEANKKELAKSGAKDKGKARHRGIQ